MEVEVVVTQDSQVPMVLWVVLVLPDTVDLAELMVLSVEVDHLVTVVSLVTPVTLDFLVCLVTQASVDFLVTLASLVYLDGAG